MTDYAWFVWDKGNLFIDGLGIYILESPEVVDLNLFE